MAATSFTSHRYQFFKGQVTRALLLRSPILFF
uniref:Uncharacterized protein n=1 Tax=Arundo donax TaxID=35708 RepID=A0A0A8ZMW7_ARUDO